MEIFDINSNDNTLIATFGCNNKCIMCCQPPIERDDIDELYEHNIHLIEMISRDLPIIGISGGEPTLLGDKLVLLIERIRQKLPNTDIHILSNGRAFSDLVYVKEIKAAAGDRLTIGIPLHSDYEKDHDIIAGANGAYRETMLGLYNLAGMDIKIELRIVVNLMNYKRLPAFSDFIFKNLPFVSWTAFMGMEYIGYAIKNREKIWIEPIEYMSYLSKAVKILADWNMDVSIYNLPLCLVSDEIRKFTRKSISDWKVVYQDLCNGCAKKESCCGLFSTSKRAYEGIKAFLYEEV